MEAGSETPLAAPMNFMNLGIIMFRKTLAIAAVLAFASVFSIKAQNLVPNGDFSTGTLQDWSVSEAPVGVVSLPGGGYGAQFGYVPQQTSVFSSLLNTIPGEQYTLSYDTITSGTGHYFVSLVSGGGTYHNYAWNGMPTDTAPGITGNNSFSINYTAMSGDKIYISYSGSTAGIVSNVTVTAVPEPSTWALLATSSLLAIVFLRRKRA